MLFDNHPTPKKVAPKILNPRKISQIINFNVKLIQFMTYQLKPIYIFCIYLQKTGLCIRYTCMQDSCLGQIVL